MSRIINMNNAIQRRIIDFYGRRHQNTPFTKERIYDLICLEGIEINNQQYLRNTIIEGGNQNFFDIPFRTGTREKYIQIIDVGRDGNCGIYAFILGLARLNPQLFNHLMNVATRNGKLLHQYLRELTINYMFDNDNRIFYVPKRQNITSAEKQQLKNFINQGLSESKILNTEVGRKLTTINTKRNRNYTSDSFLGNLGGMYNLQNNINFFRYNGAAYASNNICNSINLLQVPRHWQLIFVTDEPLTIPVTARSRVRQVSGPTDELDLSKKNRERQIRALRNIERQQKQLSSNILTAPNRRTTTKVPTGSSSIEQIEVTEQQKKLLNQFLNFKLRKNHKGLFSSKKKKYEKLIKRIPSLKTQEQLINFIEEIDKLIEQSSRNNRKKLWEKTKTKIKIGGSQFINIRGKGKRKIRYSKTGKKYVILDGKKNYKIFKK